MNKQRFLLLRVIVQSRFNRSQNIIRLKANNIIQESPELVHLRLNIDHGPSIFLHKFNMLVDLGQEVIILDLEVRQQMLLLQDIQELLAIIELD